MSNKSATVTDITRPPSTTGAVEPTTYSMLELHHEMKTPSAKDRKGQVMRLIRRGEDVSLTHAPSGEGVLVQGGAWSGIIPWSSIRRAEY